MEQILKTVKETSDRFGLAQNTIRNWLKQGKLQTVKLDWVTHVDIFELLWLIEWWDVLRDMMQDLLEPLRKKIVSKSEDEKAEGTAEHLPVITADNPPEHEEEDRVKDEVDTFSSKISSFFKWITKWHLVFHIVFIICTICFFAYDNAVKTDPIKSSAIDKVDTWAILERQRKENLLQLQELDRKIDIELEWQKNDRIEIYNLEAKIRKSIGRVRGYIKEKEEIQRKMIEASQDISDLTNSGETVEL